MYDAIKAKLETLTEESILSGIAMMQHPQASQMVIRAFCSNPQQAELFSGHMEEIKKIATAEVDKRRAKELDKDEKAQ